MSGCPTCGRPDDGAGPAWTIPLDWPRPPLSLNDRHNRHEHARIVAEIRATGKAVALEHGIPRQERVRVTLHWQLSRNGVVDEENSTPTLKALCDGITDAGVVDDDDRWRMSKPMPVLHDAVRGEPGRCWLVIEALPPIEGAPPPRAKPAAPKPKPVRTPEPRKPRSKSRGRKGPAVLPIEQLIADLQPPDGGAAWRDRVTARQADIRRQRG